MAKKEKEITCTVEFTEGSDQRIIDGFVWLYYAIKDGKIAGPPPLDECAKEKPA